MPEMSDLCYLRKPRLCVVVPVQYRSIIPKGVNPSQRFSVLEKGLKDKH